MNTVTICIVNIYRLERDNLIENYEVIRQSVCPAVSVNRYADFNRAECVA